VGFVLHIDREAWHGQIDAVASARPGLIPVDKASGYGLGTERLAGVAQAHGLTHLAVGTVWEAGQVASRFDGDVIVLTPWDPRVADPAPLLDPARLVRTVSSLVAVERLAAAGPEARIVLELATPLGRFGLGAEDFAPAASLLDRPVEALSLHLPLATCPAEAVAQQVFRALEAGLDAPEIHVSHLPQTAAVALAEATGLRVRSRIGTELWLGARTALYATGSVRAVHPVRRGQRIGYRQHRCLDSGHIIVADGGTAHGIGLNPAAAGVAWRRRVRDLVRAGAGIGGHVRSPFTLDGRRLRFADSPHAQVSMLWLPDGWRPPGVGEDLAVTVRHTITHPDEIREH
jgi:alanine racemase